MPRALCAILLVGVAAALLPLVHVGPGCCIEISSTDVVWYEEGLTLGECLSLCDTYAQDCASLEHDSKQLGHCSLLKARPTGVGCPMTEKECWARPLGGEIVPPDPQVLATHAAARLLHARATFELLECKGFDYFSILRANNFEDLSGLNHHALWQALVERRHFGVGAIGDTEAFFDDANMHHLAITVGRTKELTNLLWGDVEMSELHPGKRTSKDSQKCFFGMLSMLYLILKGFREENATALADQVAWALRLLFWTQGGGPDSTLDILQSLSWPITSWDLVVATMNMGPDGWDGAVYTYDAYVAKFPVPRPTLLSLIEDSSRRSMAQVPSQRATICGRLEVANMGIMGPMTMHQLSTMKAALEVICGADHGPPEMHVTFTYLKVGNIGRSEWHGMRVSYLPGGVERAAKNHSSLEQVEEEVGGWLLGNAAGASGNVGALRNADVVVCGEPVYACTAASRVLEAAGDSRPLFAHLGMALMHQGATHLTVVDTRPKVARFIAHFMSMLKRPQSMVSAANRITIEQIFWQVGVRLPLVPFAGLHLAVPRERVTGPKALLFRTRFPVLAWNFYRLLKIMSLRDNSELELVDMNKRATLSWEEIGRHKASVLMPHNVHLLRTSDLYAMEVVTFVPAAPFIFQFIYPSSNLYGGHGGIPEIRLGLSKDAQRAVHRVLGLEGAGYRLGVSRTAPPAERVLPGEERRKCPYRTPALGFCEKSREHGITIVSGCPWGTMDLQEWQLPLSCEEVAGNLCSRSFVETNTTDSTSGQEDGPVMDPFEHLYGDYNPWCNLDSYRYWHGYTDYALLRGLQHFSSAADLLTQLTELLLESGGEERRLGILDEMRAHQRVRQREAVHWWTQALLVTARS